MEGRVDTFRRSSSSTPVADPPVPSEGLYNEALVFVKQLCDNLNKEEVQLPYGLEDLSRRLVERITSDDSELIALTGETTPQFYLWGHLLNTAILSVRVALPLEWEKKQLQLLMEAGLFHDLGMLRFIKLLRLDTNPRKLSSEEYAMIKRHPAEGARILERMEGLADEKRQKLAGIVMAAHERINGGGYPKGLKHEEIPMEAKILGMCEVYDALIHPHWRKAAFLPHEAVETLLKGKGEEYDAELVKHFIRELSIYPVGSFVRLNTGEMGRVISANKKSPTRPALEICYDKEGKELEEKREINLSQFPMLWIESAVTKQGEAKGGEAR